MGQRVARWVSLGLMLVAAATAGCGKAESDGNSDNETGTVTSTGTGTATKTGTGTATEPDCAPWRPKGGAWTSLQTVRPANLTSVQPSADGEFLYAVGNWVEDGAVVSGVLRSKDLGTNWCQVDELARVYQVAPSPADANTVYALMRDEPSGEVSVAKSSARGNVWQSRGTFKDLGYDPRLVPLTNDANSVWLIGSRQLFISRDGAVTWTQLALPSALGALWNATEGSTTESPGRLLGIFPHPAAADRVLVIGRLREQSPEAPLARFFTTTDAGASWAEVPNVPAVFLDDVLPSLVVDAMGRAHLAAFDKLYESTDFGEHWSEVTSPALYVNLVDLDAHRGDALFACRRSNPPVYTSTDGGRSWRPIPAPDINTSFTPLYADPRRPGAILAEATGGWIATENFGESWVFGDLAVTPKELYASPTGKLWTSPPGARSSDGGISWRPSDVIGDSGARVQLLADGKDSKVLFILRQQERILRRSEDAGETWTDVELPAGAGEPTGAATCKFPHSCLYVLYQHGAGQRIARSDDRGSSWSNSSFIPDDLSLSPGAWLVAHDSFDHLFAAAGSSQLAESRDGGRSWTTLTTPESTPIISLVALPDDTLLLAGSMGLPPGGQFRSTDYGRTWDRIADEGAEFFLSASRPTTVFAWTRGQLRRSDDSGQTWTVVPPPGLMLTRGVAEVDYGKYVAPADWLGLVAFE